MKITGAALVIACLPLVGWIWEQPVPDPQIRPQAPVEYYGFVPKLTPQQYCEAALKREAKQREEGKPVMTDSKHWCKAEKP